MDALKNLTGSGNNAQQAPQGGGAGGGMMGKLNELGGGGAKGEQNEDMLDKGVDFVQQSMGGGDQSNENAAEQAKDEMISDQIRNTYKGATGSDVPIADK